jgi:hypothetical protein
MFKFDFLLYILIFDSTRNYSHDMFEFLNFNIFQIRMICGIPFVWPCFLEI